MLSLNQMANQNFQSWHETQDIHSQLHQYVYEEKVDFQLITQLNKLIDFLSYNKFKDNMVDDIKQISHLISNEFTKLSQLIDQLQHSLFKNSNENIILQNEILSKQSCIQKQCDKIDYLQQENLQLIEQKKFYDQLHKQNDLQMQEIVRKNSSIIELEQQVLHKNKHIILKLYNNCIKECDEIKLQLQEKKIDNLKQQEQNILEYHKSQIIQVQQNCSQQQKQDMISQYIEQIQNLIQENDRIQQNFDEILKENTELKEILIIASEQVSQLRQSKQIYEEKQSEYEQILEDLNSEINSLQNQNQESALELHLQVQNSQIYEMEIEDLRKQIVILVKKFNEQKVIDSPKNNKLFDVEGIKFITPELKYKSKTPNKELPQRQLKSVKSVSKLPSIEQLKLDIESQNCKLLKQFSNYCLIIIKQFFSFQLDQTEDLFQQKFQQKLNKYQNINFNYKLHDLLQQTSTISK